jgi:hypothetical protein
MRLSLHRADMGSSVALLMMQCCSRVPASDEGWMKHAKRAQLGRSFQANCTIHANPTKQQACTHEHVLCFAAQPLRRYLKC